MKKGMFSLIYEDDHIIVISKASGINVIPGRKDNKSLLIILNSKYNQIFTVHRIDKDASGLVLFAKTAESHRAMSLIFEKRDIIKHYILFSKGVFSEHSGTIEKPLIKLTNKNKSRVDPKGKVSTTHFELIDSYGQIGFYRVKIDTGRHHQIRAHFHYSGCPLLVDPIYGSEEFYLSEIKKSYKRSQDEEKPLLKRLSLHAFSLKFIHPFTEESMYFEAELPKDMRACLNQFKKIYKKPS